jgi:3-dehydroquinate dehydratase II
VRVIVVNGPNMNLLGVREPDIYGSQTLADLEADIRAKAQELGCEVVIFQTNHEGDLLDFLQREAPGSTGVVLNPASFTYQSYALYDCLNALSVPVIEVHISNLYSRDETWRSRSLTAAAARGVIMGLGFRGYLAAMEYLCDRNE